MRDRLIELLKNAPLGFLVSGYNLEHVVPRRSVEYIADHLLANGVIVPPFKVGDTVYAIARWNGKHVIGEVKVCNYTIFNNEWKIIDSYGDYWSVSNFGKTVFLTREEAEKALADK